MESRYKVFVIFKEFRYCWGCFVFCEFFELGFFIGSLKCVFCFFGNLVYVELGRVWYFEEYCESVSLVIFLKIYFLVFFLVSL